MVAALKILAPEELAAAVIGKGGAVITAMRERTQAKVSLSDSGQFFPRTKSRLLKVEATTTEAVSDCLAEVLGKLEGCAQATPSEELGAPGALKLSVVMPRAAVGAIIGKGGATIKKLQETSGAKISVSDALNRGSAADQVVACTGTRAALDEVMAAVNTEVQALSEEDWFQGWASAPVPRTDEGWNEWEAPPSKGKGKGKGWNEWEAPPSKGKGKGKGKDSSGWGYSGYSSWDDQPTSQAVTRMLDIAHELPPYVMQESRGFCVSSVVPNQLTGGLIGRGGSGVKQVESRTGCKITIRDIPDDPGSKTMSITGPLSNTCAAYMLMMGRYIDAEEQAWT